MRYLIDTNILLRSSQTSHAMHADAAYSVKKLLANDEELCIIPQNIIEFWAVATRPIINNGLGLSVKEAISEIENFKQTLNLLADVSSISTIWERLVRQHRVIGKQAHDARLVAAMNAHNLTHLLTFNADDFKRFNDITVIHPVDVA